MAEALAPRFLPGVVATSAGPRPIDVPHPYAVEVMREVDLDIRGHVPRHVDTVRPDDVDLVVALADEELRPPALRDKPYVRAHVSDPALHAMEFSRAMALEAFRAAREDIEDVLRDLAKKGVS